jgi:Rrf2 family protein
MLSYTTHLAINALMLLAQRESALPLPVQDIAAQLGASPAYATKVLHMLSRARITRGRRGRPAGIELARGARYITLLEVVEVCQGKLLADYGTPEVKLQDVCAFHQAMVELHRSMVAALSRWTIADLTQPDQRLTAERMRELLNEMRGRRMPDSSSATPPEPAPMRVA